MLSLTLSGCVTRQQIEASIWIDSGLPASACAGASDECKKDPVKCPEELWGWRYGKYRIVENDKLAFVAYCTIENGRWSSIETQKLKEILDKALPKKK